MKLIYILKTVNMLNKGMQLDEMSVIYEKLINEIEVLLQLYMNNQRLLSNTTQVSNLHSSLEVMLSLRRSRDVVIVTNVLNKVSI